MLRFILTVGILAACMGLVALKGEVTADPTVPRAVAAWPLGPLEVQVAFDRRLTDDAAKRLVGREIRLDAATRTLGRAPHSLSRKDSTETGTLKIAAARLEDEGRTVVLATDPHSREGVYTLDFGAIANAQPTGRGPGNETRKPVADSVQYDLTGVSLAWDDGRDGSQPSWTGWWPSLDPDESRRLTRGSAAHERGFALLGRPGRLTLSTLVSLPRGRVTLDLVGDPTLEAVFGGENGESASPGHVRFAIEATGDALDLTVTVRTGAAGRPFRLRAAFHQGDEPAEHTLTRDRYLVAWAPPTPLLQPSTVPPSAVLAGGHRARGEAVFFGDQAKCAQCHRVGGRGGVVGPDLGGLAGRPLDDVYRAIYDPSASISPDYVAYTVALRDGRVVVGIVRAEGSDEIRVTDTDAKTTVVRKSEIEELRPSATSIMPVGLLGVLGEERTRDLLAFLTGRAETRRPDSR